MPNPFKLMKQKFSFFGQLLLLLIVVTVLFMTGCTAFQAPETMTETEKVTFTSLKTLKSAKIFREFALESAGSIYKKGLMDEETKEKIIEIGDDLQLAINGAADALIIYNDSGGLSGEKTLEEKLLVYQALFNQFMEIVTPYVMKLEKEVN